MRITGPPLDPLLARLGYSGDNPHKFTMYITTAIMKRIRMIQQMMYPPVVTESDAKFRMVMLSTIIEIIDNMMNSYMYDRRT